MRIESGTIDQRARRGGARLLRAAARGRRGHRDPGLHALSARAPHHPAHARTRDDDRHLGRAARPPGRARARHARPRQPRRRRGPLRLPVHRAPADLRGAGHALPAAARSARSSPCGSARRWRHERDRPASAAAAARPDDLRPVTIEPGFVKTATGSALISCGETRVICTASVQESVPRWMMGKGRGWVTAEYGMLPASTGERKARDVSKGRADGRTVEIQRLIGRSPPRGRRLRGARRAHDLRRLRRPDRRRRHPLRVDHRRLRRARARAAAARRRGQARGRPAHGHGRRRLVRHRRRHAAARPRLRRGLDRRGRRERGHDRRRRPRRGPGHGGAHAALAARTSTTCSRSPQHGIDGLRAAQAAAVA